MWRIARLKDSGEGECIRILPCCLNSKLIEMRSLANVECLSLLNSEKLYAHGGAALWLSISKRVKFLFSAPVRRNRSVYYKMVDHFNWLILFLNLGISDILKMYSQTANGAMEKRWERLEERPVVPCCS